MWAFNPKWILRVISHSEIGMKLIRKASAPTLLGLLFSDLYPSCRGVPCHPGRAQSQIPPKAKKIKVGF